MAAVLIQVWQQHFEPIVVSWAGPSEDRLECCYSSLDYWWQMRASSASWLGSWHASGFVGDGALGRSSCWWHVKCAHRMSVRHLQTHPGHEWRRDKLRSMPTSCWRWGGVAAEPNDFCLRHLVSVDKMHASPWWQQCSTTPRSSWPHVLQQLEQMQTVACRWQRCDAEYGVHWRRHDILRVCDKQDRPDLRTLWNTARDRDWCRLFAVDCTDLHPVV